MTGKKAVKTSAFKYDPVTSEVSLITDLKFVYRSGSFQLDANQHGEEDLIAITGVRKGENKLEFSAEANGKPVNFELTGNHSIDNLFFDIIAGFNGPIPASPDDLDKIEVVFQDGDLSAFYIYKKMLKSGEYQLLDALRIIRETDGLFLVRQKPFRKIKLSKVYPESNVIACESIDGERYGFTLDVNEAVLGLINRLFLQLKIDGMQKTP
ncbi:hypothetical protein EGT74_21250 [Chitinophaga lutea]|uniref:Uncharacterized protein n=1 Tax=Chitinophaga lutea TaxID=2488634 RepID=A0A3N4Q0Q1_9BACT|nr:hypothetical protein [Chitinophaga lutea]RPE09520.1 hypothetical protein EGT74_21250 [Chitinophaga lutea]